MRVVNTSWDFQWSEQLALGATHLWRPHGGGQAQVDAWGWGSNPSGFDRKL